MLFCLVALPAAVVLAALLIGRDDNDEKDKDDDDSLVASPPPTMVTSPPPTTAAAMPSSSSSPPPSPSNAGDDSVVIGSNGSWHALGSPLFARPALSLDTLDEDAVFGVAVAISGDGDTVAGTTVESYGYGMVQVWGWNGANKDWTPKGQVLMGSGQRSYRDFGRQVALNRDGTILAVAARGVNPDRCQGRVEIYRYQSTTDRWEGLGNSNSVAYSMSVECTPWPFPTMDIPWPCERQDLSRPSLED